MKWGNKEGLTPHPWGKSSLARERRQEDIVLSLRQKKQRDSEKMRLFLKV